MTTCFPVPAPWHLHGHAVGVLLRRQGRLGLCLWVQYQHSNVGAYDELLWIADVRPAQGHPSIERIYVSSHASVHHGQRNWGIPKQWADFQPQHVADTGGGCLYNAAGEPIAALTVAASSAHRWPVNTAWLPAAWLTLQQDWQGQRFYYAPQARGQVRRAKLIDWHFDPQYFPDLRTGTVLAAFMVDSFEMVFPEARVETIGQAAEA